MKTIFYIYFLSGFIVCVSPKILRGIIKWSVKTEITDPKMKAQMEEAQKKMSDPATQAQMKQMQEKMNDPQMKAMMDANPSNENKWKLH